MAGKIGQEAAAAHTGIFFAVLSATRFSKRVFDLAFENLVKLSRVKYSVEKRCLLRFHRIFGF